MVWVRTASALVGAVDALMRRHGGLTSRSVCGAGWQRREAEIGEVRERRSVGNWESVRSARNLSLADWRTTRAVSGTRPASAAG